MSMIAAVITGRNHSGTSFIAKAAIASVMRPGRRASRRSTDRAGCAPSISSGEWESGFRGTVPC